MAVLESGLEAVAPLSLGRSGAGGSVGGLFHLRKWGLRGHAPYSFALGFRAEPMNPQEPTVRNPRFRFVLSLGVVPGRDQGPQSQFPQGLPVPAGRCVEQITPGAAVERITALGRPL
ncbi:hypothetical protein MTP02_44360 [Streptomyces albus]|nr:hypothetical protein MTP02_44360 [Streptomyces albus]